MDTQNIIVLAIPIFIVFMIAEMILSDQLGERAYDLGDTVSNLICGMGSQLFGIFSLLIQISIYSKLLDFKIYDWDNHAAEAWIFAFIAFDFQYYWFHRFSHKVNGLWIFHVVHHQSERYNFSVALRQSWFGGIVSWVFYCPLALIGFPLHIFLSCQALNLVYQYFIHTEIVKKLGPLEYVLNTPSHHRVHHGIDKMYLDKNYGGVFIVWDKMFDSFQAETSKVNYGILNPILTWNGVKANTAPVSELFKKLIKAANLRERMGYLFKNPGWLPGDSNALSAVQRSILAPRPKLERFETSVFPASITILTAILLIIATTYLLAIKDSLSLEVSFYLLVAFLLAFFLLGIWLDKRSSRN